MWLRRTSQDSSGFAVRFEVDQGKGVLRVTRPGVLIVPPARTHGHEDNLTASQVRSAVFLHIPGPGQPRAAFGLDAIGDDRLGGLDLELWTELSSLDDGQGARLDLVDDGDVIALGGAVASPAELPGARPGHRPIADTVRRSLRADSADMIDDVIEADSETAASLGGIILFAPGDVAGRPVPVPAGTGDADGKHTPVELEPPPIHPPSSPPPSPPQEEVEARPMIDVFSGDTHRLTRHLRRQMGRKDSTILDLESRVAQLEAQLRALGHEPDGI